MIERTYDPAIVNDIVNHPDVAPWVRWTSIGEMDLTPLVRDQRNVVLVGEHGMAVFHYRVPGVYEWHAAVRPEGHGAWAFLAAKAAIDWLFANTDAVAIIAPVPENNRPARQIVGALGFELKQELPSALPALMLRVYVLFRKGWGRQQ